MRGHKTGLRCVCAEHAWDTPSFHRSSLAIRTNLIIHIRLILHNRRWSLFLPSVTSSQTDPYWILPLLPPGDGHAHKSRSCLGVEVTVRPGLTIHYRCPISSFAPSGDQNQQVPSSERLFWRFRVWKYRRKPPPSGRRPPLLRHRRLFVEGSVWREDTLSPEETEVISPHAAQLCELCKHTPPPQPKDKKKVEMALARGNEEGILGPQRPRRKNIGSLFFFLQKYPTMTKGSGLSFY